MFGSVVVLVLLLIVYFVALSVASDAKSAADGLIATLTEGRWALLTSGALLVLFSLIERHQFLGWIQDVQHRQDPPAGEGTLNIVVRPVNNYGALTSTPTGRAAWFITDELVIANPTKHRMLIRAHLQVGIKPTSNHAAPLPLHPRDALDPSSGIQHGKKDAPLLPGLFTIEPRSHVSGKFVFSLGAAAIIQQFDGNLAIHMTGQLRTVFYDVFSETERIGGFNPVLRRLR